HSGVTGQAFKGYDTRSCRNQQECDAHFGDEIINSIPTALPGHTFGPTCTDALGHAFSGCYLKVGSQSRSNITGMINTAIQTLQYPTGIIGNGIITVTLSWRAQPDLDLHVLEPGGSHVFYLNK